MRYFLLLFFSCLSMSCIKPRYALCTSDFQVIYQFKGVTQTQLVDMNPRTYRLNYMDGTKEEYIGTCWLP